MLTFNQIRKRIKSRRLNACFGPKDHRKRGASQWGILACGSPLPSEERQEEETQKCMRNMFLISGNKLRAHLFHTPRPLLALLDKRSE